MEKILNDETFSRWFSSKTDADFQLKDTILKNKFENKKPTYLEISKTLFRCNNMYLNYTIPQQISEPCHYSAHISNKTTNAIIDKLGYVPTVGVEVGSFIGSSAIILGNMVKSANGVLMCVDTWCGDINMWLMDGFHGTMNKEDGNPKIYDHFILNVMKNNLTDTVIPLRVSSIVGARMLKVLNYEIDFVYVDSAHEAGETFMELMLYHDILKNKGILFGDDYHCFPAVKYDVDLFCKYFNYTLFFTGDGDTWLIQKNV